MQLPVVQTLVPQGAQSSAHVPQSSLAAQTPSPQPGGRGIEGGTVEPPSTRELPASPPASSALAGPASSPGLGTLPSTPSGSRPLSMGLSPDRAPPPPSGSPPLPPATWASRAMHATSAAGHFVTASSVPHAAAKPHAAKAQHATQRLIASFATRAPTQRALYPRCSALRRHAEVSPQHRTRRRARARCMTSASTVQSRR